MTRGLAGFALGVVVWAHAATATAFGWPELAFGTYNSAPQSIATDGSGTWIVAAGMGGARSLDHGLTWTPIAAGLRSVATDRRGTWVGVTGSTRVDVVRSTDRGATWTVPLPLAALTATELPIGPTVATDGAGTWLVAWQAWLDTNAAVAVTVVVRSTDDGRTWTPPTAIHVNGSSPWGPASLAIDAAGVAVIAWEGRDPLGAPDGDILAARSIDRGVTWSTPKPLNTDAATDGEDDELGELTTDGKGLWVAVWRRADGSLRSARSTNGGVSWSAPIPVSGAAGADPRICTDGLGAWLTAWSTAIPGVDSDRMVARSTDGGLSWTPGELLNTVGHTDADMDGGGPLATDGRGTWLAAWTNFAGVVVTRSAPCRADAECGPCEVCNAAGRCATGPKTACVAAPDPAKARLGLTYNIQRTGYFNHEEFRLTWTWASPESADFGDPVTADGYALCAYDESQGASVPLFRAVVGAGGDCGGRPCWEASGGSFRYSDKTATGPDGIQRLLLKRSSSSTRIKVSGKGRALASRPDGIPALPMALPVRVQLRGSNGGCWEASYPFAQTNGGGRFKASGG